MCVTDRFTFIYAAGSDGQFVLQGEIKRQNGQAWERLVR